MSKQNSNPLLEKWMSQIGIFTTFTSLADLLGDTAVFVVDKNRDVIYWSHSAQRLLGFESDEVLGQHCRKVSRCHECMVGCPISEQGMLQHQPQTLHRRDGTSIEMTRTAIAFWDAEGDFEGGIEVLTPQSSIPETIVEKMEEEDIEILNDLLSKDSKMKELFRVIQNIAETETTVHIFGESGTGKELVAEAIHKNSIRKNGPFVVINCGALSATLLESELFGHEQGAFTGAVKKHVGLFQQAEGGTIFLDEIAELPIDLQSKLLRVLEAREIVPLGASKPVKVNIRVISATHKSLKKQVTEKAFRADLLYRLRVVPLTLPPLRQRRADIEMLIWHFVRKFNELGPRTVSSVAPEAMRLLLEYDWPGNVRELRNVIEYSFAIGRGSELLFTELPLDLLEHELVAKIPETIIAATTIKNDAQQEEQRIRHILEQHKGNIGKAAEALGISRPTLWRKRKKYGL